ncbi:MAG: PDZ domain-containing protein [Deltaproteobacteria bacterium]|nr:PDZ domain-containing protein [Deltaproteobacteria bacterium]MBN2671006.1 PDZ domain-containing protein [Deltaproteobacteria bacterium]
MEKKLTKYFWVIILLTLALVAFFLASGTNELAAGTIAELLPAPEAGNVQVTNNTTTKTNTRVRVQNGDIILDRNIFDSTASAIDENPDIDPNEAPMSDGDMRLVQCNISGLKLLATVASDRDPEWSFANVEVNSEKKLCRVGDEISGRTVSAISWRYLLLRGTSDECYIDMFDQDPTKKAAPPKTEKKDEKVADKGISVDSEFERTVDRSIVDQALANPTKFAKDVRVRPYKKNGEVVGFRLRRVQQGSPIEQLGAKRGDVLHSVNGIELKSVDDALSAYQKLRSDNQLTFSVTRRGKPVDLKINIE